MTYRRLLDWIAGRAVLDRKDLARAFGRDVRTIDRWRREGRLPRPRYLHGPVWSPAQLEAALKREHATEARRPRS